jgi:predicted membrane metal-binding protein
MSVMAVLGLVLIAPRIMFFFGGKTRNAALLWVLRLASAGIGASVFVMPLAAYHFGIVTLAGFFVNIAVVPYVGFVVLPLVIVSSIASLILPFGASALWRLTGFFSGMLTTVADLIASRGQFFYFDFTPTGVQVVACYAILALMLFSGELVRAASGVNLRFPTIRNANP